MIEEIAIHITLLNIATNAAVGIIEVGHIDDGRSAIV